MRPFIFLHAADENQALQAAKTSGSAYIAGGTSLVDLMRLDVMRPASLIDVTALPYGAVAANGDGLRIGALVRNSDLAHHEEIRKRYPVLGEALLSGASPQLRNMATVGGNLLQRSRCAYFRDGSSTCNKRTPGAGCAAIGGFTRMHAVLGGSANCIAAHPSDMCVALMVLDAIIRTRAPDGSTREIPIADFHTLPGDHPEIESVLKPGELITHVDLPASPFAARSHYLKVRDRSSYAFALASAAVALELDGKIIRSARVALGGVGTKPWRSPEAEAELVGKTATTDTFQLAAFAALKSAQPQPENKFKVELAKRTLARALAELGAKS